MNRYLVFLIVLLLAFTAETKAQARMHFSEKKADFGKVHEGKILNYKFDFENTGDKPIIISEIQQGCGCVATNYPIQPILPGQKASIYAKMVTNGKKGRQNKRILIFSNAENSPTELRIKCIVQKD